MLADQSQVETGQIRTDFVTYQNRTGLRIAACLDHVGGEMRARPWVLMAPKFGETKKTTLHLAYHLVANGVNVLRFDPTNHVGESEGRMLDFVLPGVVDDIIAGLDYLENHFGVSQVTGVANSLSARCMLRVAVGDPRIKKLICVAGVVDQDLVRGRLRRFTGDDARAINGFRISAIAAVSVPFWLSLAVRDIGLADTVGLAFAIAASTFCPLLILGIWWRRLSTTGAAAGLVVGGTLASAAVLLTIFKVVHGGWTGALLSQPAAWTLPITFIVMTVVSRATPGRVPRGTARTMVRLHAPEALSAHLGEPRP